MNDNKTSSAAILAAALLLGAAPASPRAQATPEKAPQQMTFGYVDGTDAVSIEVNGEDVAVLLNGAEMPEDRCQRQGSVVTCRDGHGRAVAVFQLIGRSGTLRTLPRRPHRLRLGVTLNPPTEALAEHLDLAAEDTLFISQVYEGQAGDKAGLRRHDIITQIDGERPATKRRLSDVLSTKEPGQSVRLRVLRKGEARDVDVALEAEQGGDPMPLGFELGASAFEYDYSFPAPAELPVQYFTRTVVQTDPTFVPYQSMSLDFTPLGGFGVISEKGGGHDADLGQQLQQLEERLASLEAMLETALDRLNSKIK